MSDKSNIVFTQLNKTFTESKFAQTIDNNVTIVVTNYNNGTIAVTNDNNGDIAVAKGNKNKQPFPTIIMALYTYYFTEGYKCTRAFTQSFKGTIAFCQDN